MIGDQTLAQLVAPEVLPRWATDLPDGMIAVDNWRPNRLSQGGWTLAPDCRRWCNDLLARSQPSDCSVTSQVWLAEQDAIWYKGDAVQGTAANDAAVHQNQRQHRSSSECIKTMTLGERYAARLPAAIGGKGGLDAGVAPAQLRGIGILSTHTASSTAPLEVHKGAIATVFDNFLGTCNYYNNTAGPTAMLSIKFNQAVTLVAPMLVYLECRIDKVERGRKVWITAEMYDQPGGTMLATASGLWIYLAKVTRWQSSAPPRDEDGAGAASVDGVSSGGGVGGGGGGGGHDVLLPPPIPLYRPNGVYNVPVGSHALRHSSGCTELARAIIAAEAGYKHLNEQQLQLQQAHTPVPPTAPSSILVPAPAPAPAARMGGHGYLTSSPRLHFELLWNSDEQVLLTVAAFSTHCQGPPRSVHGGCIFAILVESMSCFVASVLARNGGTAALAAVPAALMQLVEMTVNYKNAMPLDQVYLVECRQKQDLPDRQQQQHCHCPHGVVEIRVDAVVRSGRIDVDIERRETRAPLVTASAVFRSVGIVQRDGNGTKDSEQPKLLTSSL